MTRRIYFVASTIVLGTAAVAYWLGPVAQAQQVKEKTGETARPGNSPMMQCPMMTSMKGVKLFADGPAMLIADAENLGLSEMQLKQIQEIQESARQKARDLLSDQQQEKLKDVPKEKQSLMQLSRLHMKGGKMQGKMDGMCPMCMKMMQQRAGEGGGPTNTKQ